MEIAASWSSKSIPIIATISSIILMGKQDGNLSHRGSTLLSIIVCSLVKSNAIIIILPTYIMSLC